MKKNIKNFILLLLHFFFICYFAYSNKYIGNECYTRLLSFLSLEVLVTSIFFILNNIILRKYTMQYIIKLFNINNSKNSCLTSTIHNINDIVNGNKFSIVYIKYINFSFIKNNINKYRIIGSSINIIIAIENSK